MPINPSIFNFQNSYLDLPSIFWTKTDLIGAKKPQLFLLNEDFGKSLEIDIANLQLLTSILSGNKIDQKSIPFAQAYAGHQFGHFTMLGDGRAILLGEHTTKNGQRFDIQLKGGGQTAYSRRGDGKATLKAMLREYLFSEALFHLNIPTSRSLAVMKTGEPVYRESIQEGAILTRVMKSHLRVGTFQFAHQFGTFDELKALTNYTIQRHFPEIKNEENLALVLFKKVMIAQISLITHWMRVGFIHGVMNTDNTSISGETFDYGPCAFMNQYNPETVFSSIDTQGRYAFENQPNIIKWNMIRLAESLLPLFHADQNQAIELAKEEINQFDILWNESYLEMMLNKIGIKNPIENDHLLFNELLSLMKTYQLDYTNTFLSLSKEIEALKIPLELNQWKEKWQKRTENETNLLELMKQNNPVFILRANLVEEALDKAIESDFTKFNRLLEVVRNPYLYEVKNQDYLFPPDKKFNQNYQTFCGT